MFIRHSPRTTIAAATLVVALIGAGCSTTSSEGAAAPATPGAEAPGGLPAPAEAAPVQTDPAVPPAGEPSPTTSRPTPPTTDESPEPLDVPTDPPADEDDFVEEEPLPGTPGEITGNGQLAEPPLPPAPPSPVGLFDIDFVAIPNAVVEPEPVPPPPIIDLLVDGAVPPSPPPPGNNPLVVVTDFQVNTDVGITDFAPTETGCALECVSKALLTANHTTANMHLDVETAVAARIDISLTETETSDELLFTSNGFKTKWATTLSPLSPETEYDLVLEAFDQDGQKRVHTHTFTTGTPMELPDQYGGNDIGCAGQCITRGDVNKTSNPREVNIEVETDTPASLTVWMSADEPGYFDDTPFLPVDTVVYDTVYVRTDWSIDVNYLDDATTYFVVVRAEDGFGGVEHRVGEFTTDPAPPTDVRLTFHQAFVKWDGDPHWGGLDRGEISFAWGVLEEPLDTDDIVGARREEKMDGGTIVQFEHFNTVWRSLDDGEKFPAPGVAVMERDRKPWYTFGGDSVELYRTPRAIYPSTINMAWGFPLSADAIEMLQTCGDMGFDGAPADDYCITLDTPDMTDDYARISVIVSYHIDT